MDKTEKLSFLKADHIYSAAEVPDLITDLNVDTVRLEAVKANGTKVDKGRWFGPTGLQLVDMSLTQDAAIKTVLTDGTEVLTSPIKTDMEKRVKFKGSGLIQGIEENPRSFNTTVGDYYDKASDLLYLLPYPPETVSVTHSRVEFTNGVIITVNNLFSTSYSIMEMINRKVDGIGDGWLGTGSNSTVTYTFPAGQFATIVGHRFKHLRSDYRVGRYAIEYQTVNSDTWILASEYAPPSSISVENLYILPAPIQVKAIRWRALTVAAGSAPGIGMLDFLMNSPGIAYVAKPLVFPIIHFDTVETDMAVVVSPNRLSGGDPVSNQLHIDRYHKFECMHQNQLITRAHPNIGKPNIIPFNTVVHDPSGIGVGLPYVKLTKGRWKYRLSFSVFNSGEVRYHLTHGLSMYPLAESNYGATFTTVGNNIWEDGIITIPETVVVGIAAQSLTEGAFPISLENVPTGTLELWYIDDRMDGAFPIANILPSPGMIPAPFLHHDGSLLSGKGETLFDGDNTTKISSYSRWYSAGHNVVIGVRSCFRLWRCPVPGVTARLGALSITKLDGGPIPLPYAHLPISSTVGGQWEPFTVVLPPGVYSFGYTSADRQDAEWFVEYCERPTTWDFIDVLTRVSLPMLSASGSGQTITTSGALDTNTAAWKAFTDIPEGPGWTSPANTDFTESYGRHNLPMTSNSSVGQIAAASSVHSTYQPWLAFTASPTEIGWVSAMGTVVSETNPQWISIAIADTRVIEKYVVANRTTTSAFGAVSPRDWKFQVSNDGVTWDTAHTVVGDTRNEPGLVREFILDTPVVSRFARLLITARNLTSDTNQYVCVGMFATYGPIITPQYLQIRFTTDKLFNRYKLTNKITENLDAVHSPKDWVLRAKTASTEWVVLHQVVGDTRNEPGLVREFSLPVQANYPIVQLMITAKNNGSGAEAANSHVCVQHLQLDYLDTTIDPEWF